MAEKKGVGHAYNVDFLNVVFAASSLFLFLSVIWMVWDDYDRDWKSTQRRFGQLEMQVTQANLQQAGRSVDRSKLTQLQAQEAAARKNVETNQKKVDELQNKLKDADNRLPGHESDLRPGSLRLRGHARRRLDQRRQEGANRRGRGTPSDRAQPRE